MNPIFNHRIMRIYCGKPCNTPPFTTRRELPLDLGMQRDTSEQICLLHIKTKLITELSFIFMPMPLS